MSVCPSLRCSSPDGGKGSSLSPLGVALNPDFAPMRGLKILRDDLEEVIDLPYGKRA